MASWSEAFAAQAASDLDVYERLAQSPLPQNHRLHYLQMWLEKLCKAYVHGVNLDALKTTHNVVAKVLPRLISMHWRRLGLTQQPDIAQITALCREIDLLHPQVNDDSRRPDNVEYPWITDTGELEIPAKWKFPLTHRLYSNAGRLLLKASSQLTRNSAAFMR
ncbi:MAG TPA: hypothetical protein VG225_15665 [Terracidiphilus sp.]|jgi:hypothetical protein|nr:hypothetical protein [Terracidiphilus sp.]